MSQKQFWSGVAVGSGAVLGVMVAANVRTQRSHERVARVERSVQIGADVESVFRAWSHFERIPQYCRYITHVKSTGLDRSEWTANIDGRILHWEAEITQVIPNQVIGWKSIRGPKHSGRIVFAPLGRDTLVHVHMNYEPPTQLLKAIMGSMEGMLEAHIEAALRDFKAEMESLQAEPELASDLREDAELLPPNVTVGNFGQNRANGVKLPPRREAIPNEGRVATGTHGTTDRENPVDYTRPPEANNLHNE